MAESRQRMNGFAMAVVVEGGLALVALVLAWLFNVPVRDMLPNSDRQFLREFYAVSAWRDVAHARSFLLDGPFVAGSLAELRQQVESLIGQMFPSGSLAQFALVAMLAGVGEELLFRGVLQNVLSQWTTPVTGMLITSLLFALAHALSKLYFMLASIIGLCFGWLVLQYNDLVAPMVAHSLYDFVALIYLAARAACGLARITPRRPRRSHIGRFL